MTEVRCDHRRIERFLSELRWSHERMASVFLAGSCYHLFLMLRTIWPEAEPYYRNSHVLTKIGGRYYDIRGRWKPKAYEEAELVPLFRHTRRPDRWRNPDVRAVERSGFVPGRGLEYVHTGPVRLGLRFALVVLWRQLGVKWRFVQMLKRERQKQRRELADLMSDTSWDRRDEEDRMPETRSATGELEILKEARACLERAGYDTGAMDARIDEIAMAAGLCTGCHEPLDPAGRHGRCWRCEDRAEAAAS